MDDTRLVPLGSKGFAVIDAEDWPRVSRHSWHLSNKGYARREWKEGKKRRVQLLHNFIMDQIGIDHKNRNPLDCRKENLRVATQSQNGANQLARKNNSSGYKGVSLSNGRWRAQIGYAYKSLFIGYFDTPEEAAVAYKNKAITLFGEFANGLV